jgi:3-hydroxy-9,10-secoandrosta-1,3,5(10)-triene-9,17-dione monooxygenase
MTSEQYLDRIRALLPAIGERAPLTEQTRRLPDATVEEFRRSQVLRGLRPERWGGFELEPRTFYQGVMEMAAVCPSTAWVLGVVGVHDWQLALFPPEAQREVWGADPGVHASSSYAPTGKVEAAPGGFRLRGRWSFSSGCDLCDWVILGGAAPTDGGVPEMRSFLLPRTDYRIDDTWHVAGLAGTGSKDIVVEDAFVPEHRTHRFLDAYRLSNPGQALNDGPLYRLPFATVFAYVLAAPAIGAATGALALYRTQTAGRRAAYDASRVAEDAFAQVRLAEAAARIDAGRDRLLSTFDELMALARAGEHVPVERRTRARWDAANAVKWSIEAVDLLFESSGGRAIFLANPIQRFFRDVHAMRAHALNNPDKAACLFARMELGAPTDPKAPAELFV